MAINLSKFKKMSSLDYQCFYGCKSVDKIILEGCEKLTTINEEVFRGTTACIEANLNNLSLLQTISDYAFENSGIEKIELHGVLNLKTLGPYTFKNCKSLKNFIYDEFPNLTSIGRECFRNAQALEGVMDFSASSNLNADLSFMFENAGINGEGFSVNFSGTKITRIGIQAFARSKVTSLDFSNCTALVSSENGADSDIAGNCKQLKSANFSGCTALKEIGRNSFSGCNELEEINFTGCITLQKIFDRAFQNCIKLNSIVGWNDCKHTIQNIYINAFYNAPVNIDLSDMEELLAIGSAALAHTEINCDIKNWPKIQTVDNYAIQYSKIKSVDLHDSPNLNTWGIAILGYPKLEEPITLNFNGSGIVTFRGQNNSKFVTIDLRNTANLVSIQNYEWGNAQVQNFLLDGSGITQLEGGGSYNFSCSKLFSATNCLNLTSLGNMLRECRAEKFDFTGCSALSAISGLNGSGITGGSIYDFRGCTSCTSITMNGTHIKEIYLPDSITTFTKFYNCGTINVFDFDAKNVTTIDRECFQYTNYNGDRPNSFISHNIESIGDSAFGQSNLFDIIDCSNSSLTNLSLKYIGGSVARQSIDFSGCKIQNANYIEALKCDEFKIAFDPDVEPTVSKSGASGWISSSNITDLYIYSENPPIPNGSISWNSSKINLHLSASAEEKYKEAALLLEDAASDQEIIWWCCSNGQVSTTTGGTSGTLSRKTPYFNSVVFDL